MRAATESRDRLEAAAREMFEIAARLDWSSHDPYDLLLSPSLGFLRRRSPLLGRVAVQVGRRSGAGLRSLLRIPRHTEAKALADFLRAAVLLTSAEARWASPWIEELVPRLAAEGESTHRGRGWGLSFPYVSRFTNAEARTPNVYVTTAAVEALLDAAAGGAPSGATAAREGVSFLVDGLGRFRRDGLRWFRYWPGNDARIVNVQASTASLLARAGLNFDDEALLALADESAETVISAQRPDGSWPYGLEPNGSFVDGFHTGFTLQGLADYASRRGDATRAATVAPAVAAGLDYFHARLLTPDGLPRGFADGPVSLDTQNVAQCIQTLVVCPRDEGDLPAALRLWATTAATADAPARRPRRRPLVALRWALGPRVLATAYLLRALDESSSQLAGADRA